ncbi:helix-turn-helix domain-containing protein, partial [Mycobacterium kiyosense]
MTEMTRRAVSRRRVADIDTSAAESIFAATARLLAQQSFNDISVAQILTEAGVSRATFYFYFASKFS